VNEDGIDGGAPVAEVPVRQPAFRRRASNVLVLGFVLQILALGFVVMAISTTSATPTSALVAAGSIVTQGAVFLALSMALDRGMPWAPDAATLLLWIVVGMALVRVVAALARAEISIPIDAILAGWVLSACDRPPASVSGGRRVLAPGLIVLVAGVLPEAVALAGH
jgi:hypothetical protein